jgi:hypothetical protein
MVSTVVISGLLLRIASTAPTARQGKSTSLRRPRGNPTMPIASRRMKPERRTALGRAAARKTAPRAYRYSAQGSRPELRVAWRNWS